MDNISKLLYELGKEFGEIIISAGKKKLKFKIEEMNDVSIANLQTFNRPVSENVNTIFNSFIEPYDYEKIIKRLS